MGGLQQRRRVHQRPSSFRSSVGKVQPTRLRAVNVDTLPEDTALLMKASHCYWVGVARIA